MSAWKLCFLGFSNENTSLKNCHILLSGTVLGSGHRTTVWHPAQFAAWKFPARAQARHNPARQTVRAHDFPSL